MYDTLQAPYGGTCVTTKAGMGGFTAGISTYLATGAQAYCINGKAYSKAAITATATPTTDKRTGVAFVGLTAGKKCVFVFSLNAAGTTGVSQGPLTTGAVPEFPTLPDTEAPFGYLVVTAGATTVGSWTFGTSLWDATGVTVAAQDVMMLPARPQSA